MSLFTFFSGSGNNAFKNQVKAINNNEALTDMEKMEAIDSLLNPVSVVPTTVLLSAVLISDSVGGFHCQICSRDAFCECRESLYVDGYQIYEILQSQRSYL